MTYDPVYKLSKDKRHEIAVEIVAFVRNKVPYDDEQTAVLNRAQRYLKDILAKKQKSKPKLNLSKAKVVKNKIKKK